ncbi:MAG: hypothetical protein HN420_12895 [Rhodospirillaceae bacterium]|nr:hypothetical protein [Rhodospirillaceae bacterium]
MDDRWQAARLVVQFPLRPMHRRGAAFRGEMTPGETVDFRFSANALKACPCAGSAWRPDGRSRIIVAVKSNYHNRHGSVASWHVDCSIGVMNTLSLSRGRNHDVANDTGHSDADREAMRSWIDMLRKEALNLRSEAQHMLKVAEEADTLAGRIDLQLKSQ